MWQIENHDRAGLAALLDQGEEALDVVAGAVLQGRTRVFEAACLWQADGRPGPLAPYDRSPTPAASVLAAVVQRDRAVTALLRTLSRDGPPVQRAILLELVAGLEPDEVAGLEAAFDRAVDRDLCLALVSRKDAGRFQQDIIEEVLQQVILARQAHRARVTAAVLRDEEAAPGLVAEIAERDPLLAEELRNATRSLGALVAEERWLTLLAERLPVRDLVILLRGEPEEVVTAVTGKMTTRRADELREELAQPAAPDPAARADARVRMLALVAEADEEAE
jgi:flagellar motor switch protein FliG